jgi:hypothetical protein
LLRNGVSNFYKTWVASIVKNDNWIRLMTFFKRVLSVSGALAATILGGSGAFAMLDGDSQNLFESIEQGMWQLRPASGSNSSLPVSQYCVGNPERLAQLRHLNAHCSQNIIRSTHNSVTVSYSCRGQGQGITTLRRETGRLIQIQSQGIWNGGPFNFTAEGRRIGTCQP